MDQDGRGGRNAGSEGRVGDGEGERGGWTAAGRGGFQGVRRIEGAGLTCGEESLPISEPIRESEDYLKFRDRSFDWSFCNTPGLGSFHWKRWKNQIVSSIASSGALPAKRSAGTSLT